MSQAHEDMSPEMIQRRAILQRAAWILGGAISAPAALAILQGCSARESAPSAVAAAFRFFKAEQAAVVAEIAEIMIPKTDTSGAKDAGVPAFIDLMLADVYDAQDQARFNSGYGDFAAAAQAGGRAFLEQDGAQRIATVKAALAAALAADHDPKPFILMVRELTLLGFYSSRVGITENMEYVPVPTAFHGCVPLAQMARHVYWE